jgi:hypothetical protein
MRLIRKISQVYQTIIAVLMFALASGLVYSQQDFHSSEVPKFSQYTVEKLLTVAPPERLEFTAPDVRRYRTVIRQESQQEINFSGHYRIAIWGCGTDCRGFAIIDLITGKVFSPGDIQIVVGAMGNDEPRLDFRADSQLLVISGLINEDENLEAKWFYRWKDNHLTLISKLPLKKDSIN